jgi:hypothetical protein
LYKALFLSPDHLTGTKPERSLFKSGIMIVLLPFWFFV